MNKNIKIIDTKYINSPSPAVTLHEGRHNIVEALQGISSASISILVTAYNRLEKTKQCVESILRYSKGHDFQLILLDNGSEDNGATLRYFQEICYEKKIIYRATKNVHFLSFLFLDIPITSKYVAIISNDIILTPHWIDNMMTVFESDPTIGMVCPMSSNISNLQEVNLQFSNLEEMQRVAAAFNHSNPRKWQERMRLMMPMAMWRTECLLAFEGKTAIDFGFFHDFGDDNQSFAIRRAGYKLILAGDTWVHHNHDIWNQEDKDPKEFQKSLEIGRQNFLEKYQGVDAWEDVNNYWLDITPHISEPKQNGKKRILGVDTKCGTPILDIKNRLRNFGIFEAELSAFTQLAKYVVDLNTICNGIVACDREEFLADQFLQNYFDYIAVDRPVNRYHEPQKVINDLMCLLKPGGLLMLPLLNTFSFREYLYCQGRHDLYNTEFAYDIPVEALCAELGKIGEIEFCHMRPVPLNQESQNYLLTRLPQDIPKTQKVEVQKGLLVDRFIFGVRKQSMG